MKRELPHWIQHLEVIAIVIGAIVVLAVLGYRHFAGA
jgi:uncharacterized protein involved in cysteine biosynthesis